VPYPPRQSVVPLGESLLHPLHDLRQRHPVFRLDIESEPVILDAEAPDLKRETECGFVEDLAEKGGGFGSAEDRFPVIDPGAYFIPDALSEFSFLPHAFCTEGERRFALVTVTKISMNAQCCGADYRRI
jgi:hypothetical protein